MNYSELSIADLTGLWLMYWATMKDAMEAQNIKETFRVERLLRQIETALKEKGVEL